MAYAALVTEPTDNDWPVSTAAALQGCGGSWRTSIEAEPHTCALDFVICIIFTCVSTTIWDQGTNVACPGVRFMFKSESWHMSSE
jgi:hypothetical protein